MRRVPGVGGKKNIALFSKPPLLTPAVVLSLRMSRRGRGGGRSSKYYSAFLSMGASASCSANARGERLKQAGKGSPRLVAFRPP